MQRRDFVASLAGPPLVLRLSASGSLRDILQADSRAPQDIAQDEAFWLRVRQAYTIDANQINLNSGSVSPAPRVVAEAMDRYWTITNMSPSLYVDELLYPEVELVRRGLC